MRIGSVPYLNAKPLVVGLDDDPEVEISYCVPSQLAVKLKNGEVAAGLVSAAACFTNEHLQIVPGICVSSIGPAESVLLFYRADLGSACRVALDTSSLTSVLLARVILRDRYGIQPEFVNMPPSLPEMLDACDAAVLIGDPAMRSRMESDDPSVDLGEEWYQLTGQPSVFAVWAVNPDLATPELVELLRKAKELGLATLREVSRGEAERLGFPEEMCFRYLNETLSYDLTEKHLDGLELFMTKAQEFGFIPSGGRLRLFDPAGGAGRRTPDGGLRRVGYDS